MPRVRGGVARRAVGDVEGVREQDLLRVRQQQLLMLLLVVEAELDDGRKLGIVGAGREEIEHGVVDTGTIIMNLRQRWVGSALPRSARGCMSPTV